MIIVKLYNINKSIVNYVLFIADILYDSLKS